MGGGRGVGGGPGLFLFPTPHPPCSTPMDKVAYIPPTMLICPFLQAHHHVDYHAY